MTCLESFWEMSFLSYSNNNMSFGNPLIIGSNYSPEVIPAIAYREQSVQLTVLFLLVLLLVLSVVFLHVFAGK